MLIVEGPGMGEKEGKGEQKEGQWNYKNKSNHNLEQTIKANLEL